MERDQADHHVARWSDYWRDNPIFDPEVEGALVRMQAILRHLKRGDVQAFADSEFTLEDYKTMHVLMVQPYPTEATPAQLAEAAGVTRAAMTSRLDRLDAARLITREVDPNDRRRIVVRPTQAGRDTWNRYIDRETERDRASLSALTHEELVALNALLRKVTLSLEK
jgi:DNA-binding MarR family transcriptional regulator